MARRLKLARAGAAVAGVSVALMMSAGVPAGADPVRGTVDSNGDIEGYHVNLGANYDDMSTALIGFKLDDGTSLQVYCVEIDTPIDSKHAMVEQPWDNYPNAGSPFHQNRTKINWILHNGFPVVGTEALARTLTDKGETLTDGIDSKEAITATQAAIWHFSDNKNLDLNEPFAPSKGPKSSKADVVALYKYLIGDANVGIGDQPTPGLAISPTDASGDAGTRIGPFTVSTTGDIEKLTTKLPDGVKITDANGKELSAEQIEDGTELFLDVPADEADGEGTFELTATAGVDTGRLFVGENYAKKATQSLIVAKSEQSEIVASAGGKWTAGGVAPTSGTSTPEQTESSPAPSTAPTTSDTPAPQAKNTSGDLASTGASIFAPIVIGVVLLASGVGALLFLRHRRRA
ncbi:thioester domain-containing protein [Actinophytocola oryzae]|uniref:TQXA domain-containing protein n=1 Tax=Actinophytocola oryzae TaxID=502181 RepID=A0A4R7VNZ1_9PSEU|nr:thioester domain-containing protein [Actinophytocola oryzae]TDV51078.1 TQXA domain-containing protein [Actinophytocola oryzae]